ncbi:MAG: 30S ribosomal protein S12 methylthiotransferase RimO [Phycisphaerales bacterium]|jgi:ribosomal protein S12 methylthiotransferase|nr:30S ribosomal protein S12 methylthiotransferase RimO [Phycisphaerales bacterium]
MAKDSIKSISFVSLGCPKNLVDSEAMLGDLTSAGYRLVSDDERADAMVINTCGFLEAAKDESLEVIHEAIARKKAGELRRVIVAGCLVQRHRAQLLEWAPGIDAMIGVFDRDHIRSAVSGERVDDTEFDDGPQYWIAANAMVAAKSRGINTDNLTVQGDDGHGIGYFEDDANRLQLTPRHWSYLRISEGCNQNCAFCTIPSIRGKMRSKPLSKIVSEANAMMASGVFELNLIGQDTTSWGYDIGDASGLVGLLTAIDEVAAAHGGGWVRLMYAYPNNFTDEMIDAVASLPNVVKYIDMPLQHASDRMLRAMRRNVSADEQEKLVERLRERIPGLGLRTTFITGFPGETDEDHQLLLEFVDRMQFDAMGVFRYSAEEGTVAGTLDLDPMLHVPEEVKAAREDELMLLQQEIAFENAAYVAEQESVFDVLIDSPPDEASYWSGRCYHQAPEVDARTLVHTETPPAVGELVRCRIIGSEGYDLLARPESEYETVVSLPISG